MLLCISVTLHQEEWCWQQKTLDIEVTDSDVKDVNFQQSGYILSCSLSHAIKLVSTAFGCQPSEPQASLVTTNRIINVYDFLSVVLLFMYAVLHCLYSVGNKITTTGPVMMHWGRNEMAEILLMAYSKAYFWMKIFEFRLQFDWSLSLRTPLIINRHWSRK